MLLASALGFVKLILLAYFMPADEYGQYLTYFGIATFVSLLMSLGLTEKTTKDYPRRWLSGQRQLILTDALRISRTLTLRYVALAAIGIVLSISGLIHIAFFIVIYISILALTAGFLALVGSLYRAVGSQKALQSFTLWRYFFTLIVALPAGSLVGWQGAIVGDIIGGLVIILFAAQQLRRLYINDTNIVGSDVVSADTENSYYKVYIANLVVAPQSMLDRAWISNTLGPGLAGTYGVVMLIPQIVQLLANIVVQHIGPLVIKLVHLDQTTNNRQSTIAFNAAMLAIFSLVLTTSALVAKRLPYLDYIFIKFEISDISLVMVGVIACSQIYGLIEFHLLARDREQDIFNASVTSFIIFIISFSLAAEFKAGVEWFLAGIGAARWCQVWLLRRAYLRYA
jgi:O-antigen/teichoic acid export membrane protein